MGLGLDADDLWSLTWRQLGALRRQWQSWQQFQIDMLAIIRADLHNAHMPRKDSRPWTPQEFGASGKAPKRSYGQRKWTQQEVQERFHSQGLGRMSGKPGSALAALRGTGQRIPKRA